MRLCFEKISSLRILVSEWQAKFFASSLFQMLGEKGRELVEGDKLHPVVEVNVTGVGDDEEFLWLTGKPVSLFTELSGVGGLTRDEKHGTRRNRLNVHERVEIHKLGITAERRMRGEFRRAALGCVFTSWSAVEVIKLTLNGAGVFIQLVDCPTGVFGLTASKLYITLFCCLFDDLLSLFQGKRMLEPVAVHCAHVVHADGRNGFHARINFRRTDYKAPTAANPKNTDPSPVDKRSGAQEIHRSTESLGVNIRQNRIARLPLAFSPERQIQGQSNESLFSHFRGIQIRTLFFYCAHRMPDNDRGIFGVLIQTFRNKKIPYNIHVVLIFKRNLLHGYLVALVKVVCSIGHVCRECNAGRE